MRSLRRRQRAARVRSRRAAFSAAGTAWILSRLQYGRVEPRKSEEKRGKWKGPCIGGKRLIASREMTSRESLTAPKSQMARKKLLLRLQLHSTGYSVFLAQSLGRKVANSPFVPNCSKLLLPKSWLVQGSKTRRVGWESRQLRRRKHCGCGCCCC